MYKLESEKHFIIADIGLQFVVTTSTIPKIACIIFEQVFVNISPVIIVIYITVFGYINMTKNLIGCNIPNDYKYLADYACLVIQKIANETMIVLVARRITAQNKGFGLVMPLVH